MDNQTSADAEVARGAYREASLRRGEYFSEHYFSIIQLISQSQQIHDVHSLNPTSIIEIGIGNGFTSTFLRMAGYEVTTADINDDLQPDYAAPLDELPSILSGKKFSLAMCCEVLEHMPFNEFEKSISVLRELSPKLYLTLPNYAKFFGFSGFFDVPRLRSMMNIGIYLPIPRKISSEHFWEIGSSRNTSRSKIISIIKRYYPNVRDYSYRLNRYHHAFICST